MKTSVHLDGDYDYYGCTGWERDGGWEADGSGDEEQEGHYIS